MVDWLRSSFSDRRIAVIGSLAVLSLFTLAMLAFRVAYTRTGDHTWIAWNLVLAWVPFLLALLIYARAPSASPRSRPWIWCSTSTFRRCDNGWRTSRPSSRLNRLT